MANHVSTESPSPATPVGSNATILPPPPSLPQLALTLAKISLYGFGGVLPFARRVLIEEKRWLTAQEFNELFALAQFLPGPNVVNMSAVYGLRLHGVIGAVSAVLALCAGPVAIMIGLGMLYGRYGTMPGISNILGGLAAGVAGFMITTALHMAAPLCRRRSPVELFIATAAFVAIVILRAPLLMVLAILGSLSIAYAWWAAR